MADADRIGIEAPVVTVPVHILELVARLLQLAGENSAAGYSLLEDYMDSDQKTVERRAYDLFNEIDSDIACAEGYLKEHFGGETWELFERRGLERWENMAS